MASAIPNESWVRHITGGLTVLEIPEYLQIWDRTHQIHLTDAQDTSLEVVGERSIHVEIGLLGATFGVSPNPRSQAHLKNLGTTSGES